MFNKKDKEKEEVPLKFDLVLTKPVIQRYEALVQDSVADPLDRFNLHFTYVELKEIKNDWNEEIYIIVKDCAGVQIDVGYLCINKYVAERMASISFYVKNEYRNSGVLTDCVPFVGDRVFKQLVYRRIQATALSTNKVGISIFNKWLKEEGVRVGVYEFNGKQVDRHLYGLLKKDSMWANK